MAEGEGDIRVKHWLRFFREAGLNSVDSVKYAKSFSEPDVKVKNIYKKLEHEDSIHCVKFLQLLGVKLGHTDQITDQAKKEMAGQGERQVDFVKVEEAAMEDESATTMVYSKPCNHHAPQKCMDCPFCSKHLNEKSLVRHIRVVHDLERTPNRKRKRKSCIQESTSSVPSFQQLKSSPKPIINEDLSDDSIDTVPPVISRYTPSPMEVGEHDTSDEQETGHNSLTSCDQSCTPLDLHLSHQNGLLDMEDVFPSISVVSSKSDPTSSEGTMQATGVVNIAGCTEASALPPRASFAHFSHPNRASLAKLPQPSLASSAHLLPPSSLASSAYPPQPRQASSAKPPVPILTSSANLPQPSRGSSAILPQPSHTSFANLPQINLATSANRSQTCLASSDCVKPLFHLKYLEPTLPSHNSVQPPSPKETVVATTAEVDAEKPSPTLPVIGTAWSCSQFQGAASLIFSSGRERRAVCRVGQAEQGSSSVHRIRIMLVGQALETIQDMQDRLK